MATNSSIAATLISDFSASDPSVVSQAWLGTVQQASRLAERTSKFEKEIGPEDDGNVNAVICALSNPLKEAGDQINITVESPVVGDESLGENPVLGVEEKINLGTYSVRIDFKRKGVGASRRFKAFKGAKSRADMATRLTNWEGRFREQEAFLALILAATDTTTGKANNLLWAGGGSSDDDLTENSVLNTGVFDDAKAKLNGLGAIACNTTLVDEAELDEYYMWSTSRPLAGLRTDLQWIAHNQSARAREGGKDAENPLLIGSWGEWNGIRPYEFKNPDHDNPGKGAIGSPLEPRALLRTAITSTTIATIDFGGSTGSGTVIRYVKHFPGYDWLFYTDQTTSADTTTYYFRIYDLPGTTYAGLSEVCSYTGSANNGNTFATITRNAFDLGSKKTLLHSADSLIVPCNSKGVPYAFVPVVGRRALMRGYGGVRSEIDYEAQDYKHVNGAAICTVMGTAAAKRADGKYPNFVLIKAAINPLA